MPEIFDLSRSINTIPDRSGPNGTFFQGFAFDESEGAMYVTQIMPGGIRLPGEGSAVSAAQRSINGDLAILRMTMGGQVTGQMYATSFGHGQNIGVEHDPLGGAFLWTETDSNMDGTGFGTGRKVARVKFVNGAIYSYSTLPPADVFTPVVGATRVTPSLDPERSRVLFTYFLGGVRYYAVYDFAAFKLGSFAPLQNFQQTGITGTFQGCALNGQYVYQIEGDSGAFPGNTKIGIMNIENGSFVSQTAITAGEDLPYREPEGLNPLVTPSGKQLCYGFVTSLTNPRNMALFGAPVLLESNVWVYNTRTVEEAPFAWNDLHVRYRMPRGISTQEISPGVYEEIRYYAYTDEIGAVNLPPNPNEQDTAFWPAPSAGLHFFRGGYEHQVSSQVKADLIASGVADETNFTLTEGFGVGGFGQGGFGQ